ncbi:histidine phosphatase family protein [Oscillospiraceae bacterium WX1]
MVIYLIRHGETDWNRQNRLQGIEDIELNETGLLQSADCARAFHGVPVDCILSSPLKRAKKTADIMAEHLGLHDILVEQGLTERDFGKLSGLTLEARERLLESGEDPMLEPKEDLTARLMSVLNNYIAHSACQNIVIVSHGASINAILSHLSGGEIGTGKTILKNTCVNKLSCHGQNVTIDFYNLTPAEFLSYRQADSGGVKKTL